jgi:DnaJ like chaperone protein
MIIEGLEDLRIEDDSFAWRGRVNKYEDIESVRFHAQRTKHSVNLIPTWTTYESELTLVMRNSGNICVHHDGRALFKHGKQRQAMASIWHAKEILSKMSFAARIEAFESSVARREYFIYQDYQFHKDGDVFRNGRKLFSLKDPGFTLSSSPFELHLRPQRSGLSKAFGSDTIIKTDVNEDCLYYMLRQVYGYVWTDRPVRTKARPLINPKKVFLTAMVKLAAKVAKADGTVSTEELATLKAHFGISRESLPEAGQIFNDALKSQETPEEIALAADRAVTDSHDFREYIVIGLIKIATADGTYHDKEHQIVHGVAQALGFDADDLEHILAMCGIFRGQTRQEKENSRPKQSDLVAYHCKVLGLSSVATLTEIKSAWRKLVQQHHPDHLQANGVPTSDIKAAEDILKAINASYAWLKNLYGAAAEGV